ncbi:MAG: methylmalonyl-CoA epimerase [Chloroflexi bacterium]|nr:methylmalonyl-CoA epimerase [Chloroflexota bacterium]
MIKRVNHIAIAVKNIEETAALYRDVLGLNPGEVHTVPDQGVKAVMIPIGDGEIELIEPLSPDSGVGKFLENKGEGIHHICLEVDDVDKELASLGGKGVSLIDKVGRAGLAGKVGFVHPRSTKGVLFELAQPTGHGKGGS